ncbi:FHA domain-containing protein [bacterium]|nr:FHA domain-containing protein [bacterium]
MTDIEPSILELICCPQCRGDLHYTKENVFVCVKCLVCYPYDGKTLRLTQAQALPLDKSGKILEKRSLGVLQVQPSSGGPFQARLTLGSCMVVGRKLDDPHETLVFDAHFNMVLDDNTKKIVSNYMAKATKAKPEKKAFDSPGKLGAYERLSDLVLTDPLVSRLHAMLFYDEKGVGVLDLVSQNGTFINNQEVEMGLMKVGDVMTVGKTTITLAFTA